MFTILALSAALGGAPENISWPQVNSATIEQGGLFGSVVVPAPATMLVTDGDVCGFAVKNLAGDSNLQIVQLVDLSRIVRGFQVVRGDQYLGDINSDTLAFEPKVGIVLDASTSADLKALLRKWRPLAQPAIKAGKQAIEADRKHHEAELEKWRDEARGKEDCNEH